MQDLLIPVKKGKWEEALLIHFYLNCKTSVRNKNKKEHLLCAFSCLAFALVIHYTLYQMMIFIQHLWETTTQLKYLKSQCMVNYSNMPYEDIAVMLSWILRTWMSLRKNFLGQFFFFPIMEPNEAAASQSLFRTSFESPALRMGSFFCFFPFTRNIRINGSVKDKSSSRVRSIGLRVVLCCSVSLHPTLPCLSQWMLIVHLCNKAGIHNNHLNPMGRCLRRSCHL